MADTIILKESTINEVWDFLDNTIAEFRQFAKHIQTVSELDCIISKPELDILVKLNSLAGGAMFVRDALKAYRGDKNTRQLFYKLDMQLTVSLNNNDNQFAARVIHHAIAALKLNGE
jgi:hypothetical protein